MLYNIMFSVVKDQFKTFNAKYKRRLLLIFQVPENSPVGTVVGNLSVYDPDNLHLSLQKFNCVVVNGGPFKVSVLIFCDKFLNEIIACKL